MQRRDIVPDIERLKDLVKHIDMLLLDSDERSLERAEMFLAECKERLNRVIHFNQLPSVRENNMIVELNNRVDMLELGLKKRKGVHILSTDNHCPYFHHNHDHDNLAAAVNFDGRRTNFICFTNLVSCLYNHEMLSNKY